MSELLLKQLADPSVLVVFALWFIGGRATYVSVNPDSTNNIAGKLIMIGTYGTSIAVCLLLVLHVFQLY